jgi:alginate O-acetyltransferase complex protein AlgI
MQPREFSWSSISSGAQLALVGFFKKMVIADNLAIIVDMVYRSADGSNDESNGLMIIIATYAFAWQIYCDFSGYTDIARGVARMIGFELCLNFRLPYFATNPSDFWRRWHISLSTWFRDYLYIPLGGNRVAGWLQLRNLLIVMFLAGLWHGASWNFVVWGLYHGLLLVVFHLAARPTDASATAQVTNASGWAFWGKAFGFFQLTCVGWLIFRVESMAQLRRLASSLVDLRTWQLSGVEPNAIYQLLLLSVPLIAFQVYQHRSGNKEPWTSWSFGLRVAFYLGLFYSIVLLGTPERNEFIYFQF